MVSDGIICVRHAHTEYIYEYVTSSGIDCIILFLHGQCKKEGKIQK